MKIKIIDILNKIANGEEIPKKIKYAEEILKYDGYKDGYKIDYIDGDGDGLFNEYAWITELNDEVEIIDEPKEKKIKKVNTYVLCDSDFHRKCDDGYSLSATEIIDRAFEEYSYKINEIIDKVNDL